MEDWAFLRRPDTAKASAEQKMKTVCIRVAFAGEEKEYILLENDTFEKIYSEYERKFKTSVSLEYNSSSVSRYAKAKILLEKEEKPSLRLVIHKTPPKKKDPIKYKVRYEKHKHIEIEKIDEVTVKDLLATVASKIPGYSAGQDLSLEFNGDILREDLRLDEYLQSGDLIDLLRN